MPMRLSSKPRSSSIEDNVSRKFALVLVGLAFVAMSVHNLKSTIAPSQVLVQLEQRVPVPECEECTKRVLLVIYIQYLPRLKSLDFYREIYGPYFEDIVFYVDGTWCDDPKDETVRKTIGNTTTKLNGPCPGPRLVNNPQIEIPLEVRILDDQQGGWLMQKSLMDAIARANHTYNGFLFLTDDYLLNVPALLAPNRNTGISCDQIWASEIEHVIDMTDPKDRARPVRTLFARYSDQAETYLKTADQNALNMTARNFGKSTRMSNAVQMDGIYIPWRLAHPWSLVAEKMTTSGLPFTYAFYTAIYAIEPIENISYLKGIYDNSKDPVGRLLDGVEHLYDSSPQKQCYNKSLAKDFPPHRPIQMQSFLQNNDMFHPLKFSKPQNENFARALLSRNTFPSTGVWC